MNLSNEAALAKWKLAYGKQNYAFDLSQQLILKEHYNDDHEFAWGIDFFDYEEEDSWFIASKRLIFLRNKQEKFLIDGITYQSYCDYADHYSWISKEKIINYDAPLNVDLYLQELAKELEVIDHQILILDTKVMTNLAKSLLLKFLEEYFADLKITLLKSFNTSVHSYIALVFRDAKNEKIPIVMQRAINLMSIMPIFFKRLKQEIVHFWEDENFIHPGYLFSIFLLTLKSFKSLEILEKIDLHSFTMPFSNNIILSDKWKKQLPKDQYPLNYFSTQHALLKEGFWKFPFVNGNWNDYLKKVVLEEKKQTKLKE